MMYPEDQFARLRNARMNPAHVNQGNAIQGNRYPPNTNLGALVRRREAQEAYNRNQRKWGGFIH